MSLHCTDPSYSSISMSSCRPRSRCCTSLRQCKLKNCFVAEMMRGIPWLLTFCISITPFLLLFNETMRFLLSIRLFSRSIPPVVVAIYALCCFKSHLTHVQSSHPFYSRPLIKDQRTRRFSTSGYHTPYTGSFDAVGACRWTLHL